MEKAGNVLRGPGDAARGRDAAAPAAGAARPRDGDALSRAGAEALTMDMVERFFNGTPEPQGNALAGEMIDENGPLAGRESARGKRRPGGLAMQFEGGDHTLLFAPNDAPDELPQEPTELDRLLLQQAFRDRRRFTA
jgi:hypothetical protein